jgi:hypothetical protein
MNGTGKRKAEEEKAALSFSSGSGLSVSAVEIKTSEARPRRLHYKREFSSDERAVLEKKNNLREPLLTNSSRGIPRAEFFSSASKKRAGKNCQGPHQNIFLALVPTLLRGNALERTLLRPRRKCMA